MKNNCDVSGEYVRCSSVSACEYFTSGWPGPKPEFDSMWCKHRHYGFCTSTAAIREAIEAENVREARLQALGFEPVSDEQRAENNAVHGLQHRDV
jgi:hypothetical protein